MALSSVCLSCFLISSQFTPFFRLFCSSLCPFSSTTLGFDFVEVEGLACGGFILCRDDGDLGFILIDCFPSS